MSSAQSNGHNSGPAALNTIVRTVAITGAGSGLGWELAKAFLAKGYHVFGTAASQSEITENGHTGPLRPDLMMCDITKPKDVDAWFAHVLNLLGDRGLDVLVSNAGILTPGPMEIIPIELVEHEFSVNVFGALRVINTFLPLLRLAHGRIVQIGAVTGRFPLLFNGPSSASKAALEAFADIYRSELLQFGVDFVLLQAGNMRTEGPQKTAVAMKDVADRMTPAQRLLYGSAFEAFSVAFNRMQANGVEANAAAQLVVDVCEQMPAPSRVPLGDDATRLLQLVHDKSDPELDAARRQLVGLT